MNHWLMKSELDVYPYSQLVDDGETHWDGVRNYQARNMMRDAMKVGDLVLFYHSNTKPPHVAGVARIVREVIRISLLGMQTASITTKNQRLKARGGSWWTLNPCGNYRWSGFKT